jgi:hypothetical protein
MSFKGRSVFRFVTGAILIWPLAAHGAVPTPIDDVMAQWARTVDYTVVVRSTEHYGPMVDGATIRYAFKKPDHVKAEVIDGKMRGFTGLWNGGDDVMVFRRGLLSAIRVRMPMTDKRVTSMRGSTLAAVDLGPALTCFEEHQSGLAYAQATIDGEDSPLRTMTLVTDGSYQCPPNSPMDREITKDVLYFVPGSPLPKMRVRFAGDVEVERWELSELKVNAPLDVTAFR